MCVSVRLMQNRMRLFSTAAQLFVWRLKAKTAKSTVISLLALGVQRVKYVGHYKDLGIVRDIELPDDKDIQTQLQCQNLIFPDVRTQWNMYFFVPSVRPCMHHNYGVISGRHTSTDCLGLITLVEGHCTTCRCERVLVVIKFIITFLPLRLYWDKMCTCFSKDAESLTHGCALWCSQIVYIRTYYFNITAFYFVTEVPAFPLLVWGRVYCAGHNAFVLHLALARVGLYFLTCDFRVLLWMECCTNCYELSNNYVKKVSVM